MLDPLCAIYFKKGHQIDKWMAAVDKRRSHFDARNTNGIITLI